MKEATMKINTSLGSDALSFRSIRTLCCALSFVIGTFMYPHNHVAIVLILASAGKRCHLFSHAHALIIHSESQVYLCEELVINRVAFEP